MLERMIINVMSKTNPNFSYLPLHFEIVLNDFLMTQSNDTVQMLNVLNKYKKMMSKAEEQTVVEICTIHKVPAKDYKEFKEYFESAGNSINPWRISALKEHALNYRDFNYPILNLNNVTY